MCSSDLPVDRKDFFHKTFQTFFCFKCFHLAQLDGFLQTEAVYTGPKKTFHTAAAAQFFTNILTKRPDIGSLGRFYALYRYEESEKQYRLEKMFYDRENG